MKLIVAIVQPFKVPELVDAIEHRAEFPGMTVLDSRGFGRGKTGTSWRGVRGEVGDFDQHSLVMVAAPDDQAAAIADWFARVARTGRPGDGKVFVIPIESAIRIASGERGNAAL